MQDKYFVINIREFLDESQKDNIGEEDLIELFSDFSCPKNSDVEDFLKNKAIEFTRKSQSITYLVFSCESLDFVGYYSLAIKPISIKAEGISKNKCKKLERISTFDEDTKTYTLSAYLIAQLGKNYSLDKDNQIKGQDLLNFALETIYNIKHSVGGLIEFLECEDNEFLLDFYQNNKFTPFNKRVSKSYKSKEEHTLHQLLKFI